MMKIACLSESSSDEAAVSILVQGILGGPVELSEPPLRANGWPHIRQVLPATIRGLHYTTDVEALLVVADSNNTRLTADEPPRGLQTSEEPRLAQLHRIATETSATLRPVATRPALRIGVGLAVPAIEAWLVCGVDPNVSEGAWVRGLRAGRLPYTKSELKAAVYGSDRAGRAHRTARAVEEARRLVADIDSLERRFAAGFGALARAVRAWR